MNKFAAFEIVLVLWWLAGSSVATQPEWCTESIPAHFTPCNSGDNYERCYYDGPNICCPDEGAGCAEIGCESSDGLSYCYLVEPVECPSVCPVTQPMDGDSCTIGFKCPYGAPAFVSEDTGVTFDYETM
jgi:hypothetical protein